MKKAKEKVEVELNLDKAVLDKLQKIADETELSVEKVVEVLVVAHVIGQEM